MDGPCGLRRGAGRSGGAEASRVAEVEHSMRQDQGSPLPADRAVRGETDEIQDAFVGRLQRTTNGVACALFAQQLGNTVNARVSHDPIDHYRYDYA